jgi:hypothetical protein
MSKRIAPELVAPELVTSELITSELVTSELVTSELIASELIASAEITMVPIVSKTVVTKAVVSAPMIPTAVAPSSGTSLKMDHIAQPFVLHRNVSPSMKQSWVRLTASGHKRSLDSEVQVRQILPRTGVSEVIVVVADRMMKAIGLLSQSADFKTIRLAAGSRPTDLVLELTNRLTVNFARLTNASRGRCVRLERGDKCAGDCGGGQQKIASGSRHGTVPSQAGGKVFFSVASHRAAGHLPLSHGSCQRPLATHSLLKNVVFCNVFRRSTRAKKFTEPPSVKIATLRAGPIDNTTHAD